MLAGRDIVILGSAAWETVGPLNCHHIARRLAERNRVLFVESPGLRSLSLRHGPDLAKLSDRLFGLVQGVLGGPRRVEAGLRVLSPAVLPFLRSSGAEPLNAALLARACRRGCHRLGFSHPVLWSFLPTAGALADALAPRALIYHCVDDYAGNPGVDAARIERKERRLSSAADLCLATSRPLAERLAGMGARVACVPNVAEVGRFGASTGQAPDDVARLPRPVIGYVGNVASYKVDLDLVRELAERRADCSFALVGPIGLGDPSTGRPGLAGLSNVYLLGPRPYEEIPRYVQAFDVCLIPFRRGRPADSALPLKTFEYLAAGRPVVATPLPALRSEPLDGVLAYAEGAEEFARAIETCLQKADPQAAARRRSVAARYSWEARFPQIEDLVADVLAQKEP
jgi:glycosyltransferase involved in cell wall biosynthesis